LAKVKFGALSVQDIPFQDMLFGAIPGSLGEVAALALLIGFAYLLCRRVITWHLPVTILATMSVVAFVVALGRGESGSVLYEFPLFHILAGGAILGSVFMATDYSTSPMTIRGAVIYGVGIGLITMFIRLWGSYPEGMSFAILIMNSTVPLINRYVKPRRFGAHK
jgi:electron transport complex protein RnfD